MTAADKKPGVGTLRAPDLRRSPLPGRRQPGMGEGDMTGRLTATKKR